MMMCIPLTDIVVPMMLGSMVGLAIAAIMIKVLWRD